MKLFWRYIFIFGVVMNVVCCDSVDQDRRINNNQETFETINITNNREIIATLDQTVQKTPKWDQVVKEIREGEDYNIGHFNKSRDRLVEELAIQTVVIESVIPLLENIYGGRSGFEKEGVIFFESSNKKVDKAGFWIGIKDPDNRLDKFVEELQKKVDEGEIKADSINIFHTQHTESENNHLMREVNDNIEQISTEHGDSSLERSVSVVGVNSDTGNIEIGHHGLTEEQKKDLEKSFPNRKIIFYHQEMHIPENAEKTFHPN
ncbi:hypothetical protein CN378_10675 [Bacillus sp. AFS015802]|uniref:hypothetical protein n=1 Tax=Bacillus sp. AFS015802 TaxID=2033486 RepID=UPI000BF9F13C|nr:hypothetical protein [Bacillus sp. AFS015802]PFA67303.1 hypothetical protein CN378_10675 [Bacillus sp. AFS015802]